MNKNYDIKVRITRLVDSAESKVKAYADITLDDSFVVHGLSVLDTSKGLFVKMPFNSFKDKDGTIKYKDSFHAITTEARKALTDAVLEAYDQKLEQESKQDEEIEDGMTQSM